jgi:hypothetical protein
MAIQEEDVARADDACLGLALLLTSIRTENLAGEAPARHGSYQRLAATIGAFAGSAAADGMVVTRAPAGGAAAAAAGCAGP